MSFLDSLGDYLREVARLPDRPDAPTPPGSIDPAFARNALIRSLERLEQEYKTSPDAQPVFTPESLFEVWLRNDAVVRFARRMAELLRESIGKDASAKEIEAWIELAIAKRVGLSGELSSRIRTLELERIAGVAWADIVGMIFDHHIDVVAYASAIRATHGSGKEITLTPIGRVFLELKGRDAIRWLLHVEAAQSFGPSDPWRVSRETANALVRKKSWVIDWDRWARVFLHSWETLKRLEAFGLVSVRENEESQRTWIDTLPVGQELLAEISRQVESPMSVLAGTIISDLTLATAETAAGRTGSSGLDEMQSSAVAEATARQARLVAHEIRNLLVPIKTTLGAFCREVQMEPPVEVVARRREGIDRGINSIFRFIDQLVGLAALTSVSPERFDPLSAIRDAVVTLEGETGRSIEQALPATLPQVSGHRARVVMALVHVLRNAVQAAPAESSVVRLQVEAVEGARAVRLCIEDNGPGVPEAMRRAIFDEGISLRSGSGLGLALVREVFEREMKGLVACDASPLGGARFVIRIPATATERS